MTRSEPSAWLNANHLDGKCAAFFNVARGVRHSYCHVVATYDMRAQNLRSVRFDLGKHLPVALDVFRSGVNGFDPLESGLGEQRLGLRKGCSQPAAKVATASRCAKVRLPLLTGVSRLLATSRLVWDRSKTSLAHLIYTP